MRRFFFFVSLFLVLSSQLLVFQHCANPTPPQGGLRDTIGPILIQEASTPGFQTNFKPQRIELTFDEWVKIKDPSQIIISPPLEPQAKISLKKKTLIIDFGEAVLRDSATYVLNIGEAIVDLNESNPPDNLRFVFATGPVLDSASVSGLVLEAYSAKPVEGAMVGLYAELSDSAIVNENPFYFAKTNKEGAYEISNIRPGTYRLIAIDNGGFGGYKYNPSTSKGLAFLDTFLQVPNAALAVAALRLYANEVPLRLLKKDTTQLGLVKVSLNKPAQQLSYAARQAYQRVNKQDTVQLFYTHRQADTILFNSDIAQGIDTLLLRPGGKAAAALQALPAEASTQPPFLPYTLGFNHPLKAVDTLGIYLYRDTLPDRLPLGVGLDSQAVNQLVVRHQWEELGKYRLLVLPGALTDLFGQINADTISRSFTVDEQKKFGNLQLTISGLDTLAQYVVRLVKANATAPEREFILQPAQSEFTKNFIGLLPAAYQVEIILDQNRNGRYDAGDYFKQQQVEKVQIFTPDALRPNWDLEASLQWKSD